jgi:hypothetical protein
MLLCLFAWSSQAVAQVTTADIVGTVTDATGAVLPDATVTVINTGTGISKTLKSGKNGDYVFNLMQIGTYDVTVELAGFKTFVAHNLTLAAGDRARLDAKMTVGAITESIAVSAEAVATLQTDSSTIGTLIDDQAVQDIPLNARNLINFIELSAGVTEGNSNAYGSGTRAEDRRLGSAYSVNGQSDNANTNLIDGMDNNERLYGVIGIRPSVDAVEQVKVVTNLYTAEVGRTAGGVADVITKSGTNSFHGSAFEYLRNDKVDSEYFFAANKPELRQNQFGFSLGGKILKDKTFFFGDYEGFRLVKGETATGMVPSTIQEGAVKNQESVTFANDYSNPDITASDITIDPANFDPVGRNLFLLYPAPNYSGSSSYNYVSNPNIKQNTNTFDIRADHHFRAADTLFARYSYNNIYTLTPGLFPSVTIGSNTYWGNGGTAASGNSHQRVQHLGLDYLHVFRPTLFFEAKAGYLYYKNNAGLLNGNDAANNLGFECDSTNCLNVGFGGAQAGLPQILLMGSSYTGLGDSSSLPINNGDNTFQYQASLSWNHGSHSIKTGVGLIRRQVTYTQGASAVGTFGFLGGYTGTYLGDMLTGQVTQEGRSTELISQHLRSWEISGFVQDDYKVRHWLTLNLGIRYDLFTPYTETNGYISNFNPTINMLVSPTLLGTQHSSHTGDVEADYKDVSPRFGFAATLGHGMVFRGGFGMTFYPAATGYMAAMNNAPFNYGVQCGELSGTTCPTSVQNSLGNPQLEYGMPMPVFDLTTATDISNYSASKINALSEYLPASYLYQFTGDLEKQFGANVASVTYIGNLGHRLPAGPNINQSTTSTSGWPIEELAGTTIDTIESIGSSSYNALQASLQRRFAAGLNLSVNYTWSHTLGDAATLGETGTGSADMECVRPGCLVDSGNGGTTTVDGIKYDWGNSDFDVRQHYSMIIDYQLPFGKNLHGPLAQVVKSWTANVVTVWQTGQPFVVLNRSDISGILGISGGDHPDVVSDPLKPGAVSANPSCTVTNTGVGSIHNWFNGCAFMAQTAGTLGNEHRNQLFGPHQRHVDFSLSKEFPIWEATKLQFRAEAFNITNTPNFAIPSSATVGVTTMNQITSTSTGYNPRELQFALKLLF